MKKIVLKTILYSGIAASIALLLTLTSSNFHFFIRYFVISLIISFSIGINEEILFRLAVRINTDLIRIKTFSITLSVIGALMGTEIAVILIRYLMHTIIFKTIKGHLILLLTTLILGLIISIIMTYYHESRYKLKKREAEIEHLMRLDAESKYAVLQSKVNPHFLFNTLSTITGMVYNYPEKAEKMILNLSSLYRTVLNLPINEMISIETELEIVNRYIEIEKMRMGKRLNFNISTDKETLYCKIPPMIIEMLVENAVIHGISPKKEGGSVNIIVTKRGEKVHITVKDNGIGIEKEMKEGFALLNIRNRLKVMTKESKFNIQRAEEGINVSMEFVCENKSDSC